MSFTASPSESGRRLDDLEHQFRALVECSADAVFITDFDSEFEAAEAARSYLTASQSGPAVDVSLVIYNDDDQPVQSLEGAALAAWVRPNRSAQQLA